MKESSTEKKGLWRYEYKMVATEMTLEEIISQILHHPYCFVERYPERRINNVYFDTHELTNYHDALAGISRRSKLRFRWYGESFSNVKGCLELKVRKGSLLTKIIQKVNCSFDFNLIFWRDLIAAIEPTVKNALRIELLYAHNPMLINYYYRRYYENFDGSCRITIDFNHKSFDQRPYNRPNITFANKEPYKIVIEFKAYEGNYEALIKATNFFPLRVTQNSKYITSLVI